MTEIEKALIEYDGDNSKPYCDLVWKGLKTLQAIENNKHVIDRLIWDSIEHLEKIPAELMQHVPVVSSSVYFAKKYMIEVAQGLCSYEAK